jgi:hypothetical protein
MGYAPRQSDFVAKAGDGVRIGHHRGGQELEGDLLAEREVVGAIDFAHSAAAEQSDDPVPVGE